MASKIIILFTQLPLLSFFSSKCKLLATAACPQRSLYALAVSRSTFLGGNVHLLKGLRQPTPHLLVGSKLLDVLLLCQTIESSVRKGSLIRSITLDVGVGGLSCASGAASLQAVASRVPGVERVMVDLAMERVSVTFGTNATSVQAIAKAISAGLVQGDRYDGMRD